MRVGLDTSFLDRPPSGIGAYVSALLEWLPQVDARPRDRATETRSHRTVRATGERGARFLWETVGAGRAAASANVDLLHMPMMATP